MKVTTNKLLHSKSFQYKGALLRWQLLSRKKLESIDAVFKLKFYCSSSSFLSASPERRSSNSVVFTSFNQVSVSYFHLPVLCACNLEKKRFCIEFCHDLNEIILHPLPASLWLSLTTSSLQIYSEAPHHHQIMQRMPLLIKQGNVIPNKKNVWNTFNILKMHNLIAQQKTVRTKGINW